MEPVKSLEKDRCQFSIKLNDTADAALAHTAVSTKVVPQKC